MMINEPIFADSNDDIMCIEPLHSDDYEKLVQNTLSPKNFRTGCDDAVTKSMRQLVLSRKHAKTGTGATVKKKAPINTNTRVDSRKKDSRLKVMNQKVVQSIKAEIYEQSRQNNVLINNMNVNFYKQCRKRQKSKTIAELRNTVAEARSGPLGPRKVQAQFKHQTSLRIIEAPKNTTNDFSRDSITDSCMADYNVMNPTSYSVMRSSSHYASHFASESVKEFTFGKKYMRNNDEHKIARPKSAMASPKTSDMQSIRRPVSARAALNVPAQSTRFQGTTPAYAIEATGLQLVPVHPLRFVDHSNCTSLENEMSHYENKSSNISSGYYNNAARFSISQYDSHISSSMEALPQIVMPAIPSFLSGNDLASSNPGSSPVSPQNKTNTHIIRPVPMFSDDTFSLCSSQWELTSPSK